MTRENRFFILSAEQTGRVPVIAAGKQAIANFAHLVERLDALCGRDAAGLFAEPVLPRGAGGQPTAISWYGPFEGRSMEVDAIDEVARKPIADRLAERLNALAPAFADRDLAPLLAASLCLTSNKDILTIGGEPLLVNWGFMPQEAAQDPASRLEHFSRTLGRFAPGLIPLMAQALAIGAPTPAASAPSSAAAESVEATPPPSSMVLPPAPSPPRPGAPPVLPRHVAPQHGDDGSGAGSPPAWRAPLVATAIAAATLLVLLLPGVLVYPDLDSQAAQNNFEAVRLRQSNVSLEAQLKALQKADRERVCRADGTVPVPGLAPTDSGKPEPPPQMELLPRPPDKVPLLPRTGEPPQAATIAEMLENATVYVFVIMQKGASSGSGFFIGDRYIVTNRHVVENAIDEAHIYVASRTFGGVRRARVIAKTPPLVKGAGPQPDFAVLEVEPVAGVSALKLGGTPPKLSTAYIAGYPGFLVAHDVAFDKFIDELKEALTQGDDDQRLAARRFTVPGADLRYGRINNTMTSGNAETPIIVHDMQIAHGNSGGPLVDACGRLGGVNSLFYAEASQVGNVALDVGALRKFLTEKQIPFTADDSPCGGTGPTSSLPNQPPPTASKDDAEKAPTPPGQK
jgi:S1-C subfamily serine protease